VIEMTTTIESPSNSQSQLDYRKTPLVPRAVIFAKDEPSRAFAVRYAPVLTISY
jgi:hypothetical protein